MTLRNWQKDAFRQYRAHILAHPTRQTTYLLEACPGAGKTRWAFEVAKWMLRERYIHRIIITVPTAHLRQQWAETAAQYYGLTIDCTSRKPSYWVKRTQGAVITYAQLAQNPTWYIAPSRRALVINDEIHHGGEGATWGDSLRVAFGQAAHVLNMSGTPFRSDNLAIPFVQYTKGGLSQSDYVYGLGNGLADDVIRPIAFFTYGGTIDSGSKVYDWNDPANDKQRRNRLQAALHTNNGWLPKILTDAHAMLRKIRQTQPNAGGLVVCRDKAHADAVADTLTNITGKRPTIVLSDLSDASDNIDKFREGDQAWLVSVRMVSEGIDIPRFRVGVFATNITTAMYFRQFIGRITRVTHKPPQTAYCYIPSDPRLIALAQDILRQQRHFLRNKKEGEIQLELNEKPELQLLVEENAPEMEVASLINGETASTAHLDQIYINGQLALFPDLAPESSVEIVHARVEQQVMTLRDATPVADVATPRDRAAVSAEITNLVGQAVRHTRQPHSQIYSILNNRQRVRSQAECSHAQLRERTQMLRKMLSQ